MDLIAKLSIMIICSSTKCYIFIVMLNVIMLCRYAQLYISAFYAECHYAECHYADCHYTACWNAKCLCYDLRSFILMLNVFTGKTN
jgi:hypothetical protein